MSNGVSTKSLKSLFVILITIAIILSVYFASIVLANVNWGQCWRETVTEVME